MTPKFEPGEIVILLADTQGFTPPPWFPPAGSKIKLIRAFTESELQRLDARIPDGDYWLFEGSRRTGVHERLLEKIPPDHVQKFRETLIPCDDLYRQRLNEKLNPVPVRELEARIARIFPSLDELNKRQQVFHALYGTKPLWGFDE